MRGSLPFQHRWPIQLWTHGFMQRGTSNSGELSNAFCVCHRDSKPRTKQVCKSNDAIISMAIVINIVKSTEEKRSCPSSSIFKTSRSQVFNITWWTSQPPNNIYILEYNAIYTCSYFSTYIVVWLHGLAKSRADWIVVWTLKFFGRAHRF